jgi:HK97 family phage portal protein
MSIRQWIGQTLGLGLGFRKFWAMVGMGDESWSGEEVTADRALQIPAVMRGVRLEAQTVATLPCNTYENSTRSVDPVLVRDGPYDHLLRISPNADQTTCEFLEAIVGASRIVGNGYALKRRNGVGMPVALELTEPNRTEPYRDENKRLKYRGHDQNGDRFDVFAADMLHVKGFSFGGDRGLSVVEYGAQQLGTQIAANKTAGKIFRSGLGTSGFIETKTVLDAPERTKLEKIFARYQGTKAPDKFMLLEGDMKFTRTSMSAADAQLLLQIQFGIEEIARWLDMPPVLLMHSAQGVTQWGTGVEAIILAWLQLGLRAQLTRLEKTIVKRLFEPVDQGRFFVKFNIDALLRGDSAAQAALFSQALQNGWMTRNEVRRLLDLPLSTEPGADELTVQVNMTYLKDLGAQSQQTAQQARVALMQLLGLDTDPTTGQITIQKKTENA